MMNDDGKWVCGRDMAGIAELLETLFFFSNTFFLDFTFTQDWGGIIDRCLMLLDVFLFLHGGTGHGLTVIMYTITSLAGFLIILKRGSRHCIQCYIHLTFISFVHVWYYLSNTKVQMRPDLDQ